MGREHENTPLLDTSIYKSKAKSLFVSATPSVYELQLSSRIVQQIIRPTGLLDPITYVYPKSGNYSYLLESIEKLQKKKKNLQSYFDNYEDIFQEKRIFS